MTLSLAGLPLQPWSTPLSDSPSSVEPLFVERQVEAALEETWGEQSKEEEVEAARGEVAEDQDDVCVEERVRQVLIPVGGAATPRPGRGGGVPSMLGRQKEAQGREQKRKQKREVRAKKVRQAPFGSRGKMGYQMETRPPLSAEVEVPGFTWPAPVKPDRHPFNSTGLMCHQDARPPPCSTSPSLDRSLARAPNIISKTSSSVQTPQSPRSLPSDSPCNSSRSPAGGSNLVHCTPPFALAESGTGVGSERPPIVYMLSKFSGGWYKVPDSAP